MCGFTARALSCAVKSRAKRMVANFPLLYRGESSMLSLQTLFFSTHCSPFGYSPSIKF
jgi:hypothetical protein